MTAKLVWKPFAFDGQRVEAVEMEGGSTAVPKLVSKIRVGGGWAVIITIIGG